ncbi:uncharacterized protein BJ171DRAFT_226646 [Polychytrium aggregatum]|uniref:uncharacterized protein n=1 Tax=Polychytrium aggregatum TaxID=110093 RepID=UPI0022FE2374|nr:uncharacterized protein BJ171DRAFT_226646 [Polychytrium aggregatum]KAI9197316.1 hypothetical protein BJ171DRAFT_226646 [Polychytrium aggregatum]
MNRSIYQILSRLLDERLVLPTSALPPPDTALSGFQDGNWVVAQEDQPDPDSKETRWFRYFNDYFLEAGHSEHNDDLLFFVRHRDTEAAATDPLFLRRKVGNVLPPLTDLVDWKETFFLNLIVQLPCTLTVSVCKRQQSTEATDDTTGTIPRKTSSLIHRPPSEKVLGDPVPVHPSHSASHRRSIADPPIRREAGGHSVSPDPRRASLYGASAGSDAQGRAKPKPKMVALRRVCKQVYAAPYKSRMDVKDAFMNECSYPLVYYTINDYESDDLHLPIRENEHLCVELSVMMPQSGGLAAPAAGVEEPLSDSSHFWDNLAAITVDQDPTPFPTPAGYSKVVLFQGAVPYSSLSDIYQEKGIITQNPIKSTWHSLTRDGTKAQSNGSLDHRGERIEYIMMRGPNGKGQCQVAITNHPKSRWDGEEAEVSPSHSHSHSHRKKNSMSFASQDSLRDSSESLDGEPRTSKSKRAAQLSLVDRIKIFSSSVVRAASSLGTSPTSLVSQSIFGLSESDDALEADTRLECSMTYVNVPWQFVINDLVDHVASQRNGLSS